MTMRITYFAVKNWRNFKSADIDVVRRVFIVGPNASGKSNLLDALRFLGEIAADGGGLQQAVRTRGGMGHVRCLAARNFNRGRVELKLRMEGPDALVWDYRLEFSSESRGRHRPLITAEEVFRDGERLLTRPSADDESDPEMLTQTALEQVTANRDFREIVRFLQAIRYVHLVPQLIREPELAGETDESPYGREFLARIAGTPEKSRTRRLAVVNRALNSAVPQLEELELTRDDAGRPHLQARYRYAVEGPTDEPLAKRLIEAVDMNPKATFIARGKSKLDPRLPGYNAAGRHSAWLVLRDLDHDDAGSCVPALVQSLLGVRPIAECASA